jgi:hypothetical protein
VAEFCANQAGVGKRSDYAKALEDAGIRSLMIGVSEVPTHWIYSSWRAEFDNE